MNATIKDFATLLLRLWLGLNLALAHGWPKLADTQAFLSGPVQDFPFPTASGWFAMLAESVGGVLLAVGFYTRAAALTILGTMLGAGLVFLSHGTWMEREFPLTYAMLALFFLLHGPGDFSVDGHLSGRKRSRDLW